MDSSSNPTPRKYHLIKLFHCWKGLNYNQFFYHRCRPIQKSKLSIFRTLWNRILRYADKCKRFVCGIGADIWDCTGRAKDRIGPNVANYSILLGPSHAEWWPLVRCWMPSSPIVFCTLHSQAHLRKLHPMYEAIMPWY